MQLVDLLSRQLDYVKSLRVLTDVLQQTTFVSLYQAGESTHLPPLNQLSKLTLPTGIYKQFDKVLVINKGRQVYFGPADEARNYFVSIGYKDLPRQTTADYLTGCSTSPTMICPTFI
jgi:ATP-binding cassette subfamily G (WHITE) protein 2 (SNQ2)